MPSTSISIPPSLLAPQLPFPLVSYPTSTLSAPTQVLFSPASLQNSAHILLPSISSRVSSPSSPSSSVPSILVSSNSPHYPLYNRCDTCLPWLFQMLFCVFMFYTLFLFLLGAHAHNLDFNLLSTNMNGLGNAFKLHLIASLISTCLPLAFVLCETKSPTPMLALLNLQNYALYENPALPVVCSSGKWGVVLGVKKMSRFFVNCRSCLC